MPLLKSTDQGIDLALQGSELSERERIEDVFVLAFVDHDYSGMEVLKRLESRGFTVSIQAGAIELRKGERKGI